MGSPSLSVGASVDAFLVASVYNLMDIAATFDAPVFDEKVEAAGRHSLRPLVEDKME